MDNQAKETKVIEFLFNAPIKPSFSPKVLMLKIKNSNVSSVIGENNKFPTIKYAVFVIIINKRSFLKTILLPKSRIVILKSSADIAVYKSLINTNSEVTIITNTILQKGCILSKPIT